MELPQQRSIVSKGGNPTHDFLSLYNQTNAPSVGLSHLSHATTQIQTRVDNGSLVETHDFLQPLERAKEKVESRKMEKSRMAVEHILPGGLGTYSISHISYYNQQSLKRKSASTFPSDKKSNSTGFTLWNESSSSLNKSKLPQHKSDSEEALPKPPLESNFPSPANQLPAGTEHQSFIEIMNSRRSGNRDEEFEEDEETSLKREYSCSGSRGELTVRVDTRSLEQKASTPRSKHSATEQRRRSKINDRFQMLREIIPQSDQKRDKASFLLEVIEYIQFLQVKVRKYEECCPPNSTPWGNRSHDGGGNAETKSPLMFSSTGGDVDKLKEHEMRIEGGSISLSNVYSQGLLDTLTRALQSSGVDLTRASLSVQIDLGKRASGRPGSSKENSDPSATHEPISSRSRGICESDEPFKKPKIA